ncbi:hypothetical protein KIV45_19665 [Janthinobacterium lividum]|nr:hypothetical protein KIV45_19665 [Janthinobacterium lividum]
MSKTSSPKPALRRAPIVKRLNDIIVVIALSKVDCCWLLGTSDLLAVVLPFLHGAGWVSNWRFLGSQLLISGNIIARGETSRDYNSTLDYKRTALFMISRARF